MGRFILVLSLIAFLVSFHFQNHGTLRFTELESFVSIPVNGNSWYLGNSSIDISTEANFAIHSTDTLSTFFSIKRNCEVSVSIVARSETEEVSLDAIFGNVKRNIKVRSSSYDTIPIGKFTIDHPGYQHLDLVNTTG